MLVSLLPYSFALLAAMVFGTFTALSSSCWLGAWVGLEINLIGFIPLLVYGSSTKESESGIVYFVVQSLGSGLFMLGSLISFDVAGGWDVALYSSNELGLVLISIGLMIKLGGFPFHSWFPQVMAGGSWFSCLMLVTWQKVGPLFLFSELVWGWINFGESLEVFGFSAVKLTSFLFLAGSIGSLVGGYGGVNQTEVRPLLAYSSIGHIGWMLFSILMGWNVLVNYFIFYFFISICFFIILWRCESHSHTAVSVLSSVGLKFNRASVVFMLLSLGGMPPLLGFYPKLVVILACSSMYSPIYLGVLMVGSLVSLSYYLSLLFSVFLSSASQSSAGGGMVSFSVGGWNKILDVSMVGPIFVVNCIGCVALVFSGVLGLSF